MKYAVAVVAAIVVAALLLVRPFQDTSDDARVLFVGNSYTTSNGLPAVFADLASAGGYSSEVGVVAWGGAWLRDHVERGEAPAALLDGDWDYVVLQEQSVVPATAYRADQRHVPRDTSARRCRR